MVKSNSEEIIQVLDEFVSDHKKQLVDQVIQHRTRQVTLVFEDIDKPHNISAVVRTAECMGVQDLHFIKNQNDYSVNQTITQGASKWLTFHHYNDPTVNNIDACYSSLRANDYRIFCTSLTETSKTISSLDPTHRIALVFGTEADGISEEAGSKADGFVHIPMQGFTESFNLSVSAALCLNVLQSKGKMPGLSEMEAMDIKATWYRNIVREADLILKEKGVDV